MKGKWLVVSGLVILVASLALAGCTAGGPSLGNVPSDVQFSLNSQQQGIWVSGQGKVTVAPDVANLRLGVEAQADSVALAQSQANEVMDRVMVTLTDNGVAKNDIKTQYFNINKITRWDKDREQEVVIGYRVTNMVNAKIREVDKAGAVIDAVAGAGGDLVRVDSISFSIDDPTQYQAEAREKAMAEAREKAEQMAKLAKVSLGKPTYISESSYAPPPIYRETFVAEGAMPVAVPETPISPGEMEITLNVQIAYAIR
ncbi:MAG: SIMPL domain-containing protein [Chloroflexota bacterium]